MIVVQRSDDGREIRWRPEEYLERLAYEVDEGMLTNEQAEQRVRATFPGQAEEWYRDLFNQWLGWF